MNWWRRFFKSRQLEKELDAELRFHVETMVDESIRSGVSPSEARRRARLEFGGLDQVKEDCRDVRGTRWLADVGQDFWFAIRLLARQRSSTLVAAIVLGLGIGANGLFFTMVEMFGIRGLPFQQVDRMVYVATRDARGTDAGLSYADFEDIRHAARTFLGLSAFAGAPMAVGDEDRAPDRFGGAYISSNAFGLLRVAPALGRDFVADDDRPGAAAVVIIGDRVWNDRYNRDPATVGRTIHVNGVAATVIGVMTGRFRFPSNADVWLPLAMNPQLAEQGREVRPLGVFGRLADEATVAQARGDVDAVALRLAREYPATNTGVRTTVVPINERYNADVTQPVWVAFMTAGTLVLLIACANVANLLLMRAAERSREIAIRGSLGATRWRLVRQLLVESVLLATIGATVGLGLLVGGLRLVSSVIPENTLPYWVDFTINQRIIAFLVATCLGTSIISGLTPALHLSKTDVNGVLKEGGRILAGGLRGRRWTSVLLACQVAVALLLLANLGLGARAIYESDRRDPAIDMPGLLSMSIALPKQRYRTPDERLVFYQRLDERLRGIESIASAAIATNLPFGGAAPRQLVIDGVAATPGAPLPLVRALTIGARYFETIGLPLIRGRAFDERDGAAGHESVIVNQRFVDLYFENADPLGRRIQLSTGPRADPPVWLTIVGISPTIRQRTIPEPDPVAYLPYRADPPDVATLIVRGGTEPMAIAPVVREEVRTLDPDLPLYRVMTMERAVAESRWNGRVSNLLLMIITCIAVALSAVGLYAVTSHSVAQRTHEIGIRLAIGAQASQMRWLVLRRTMLQLAVGLAAGVVFTKVWEGVFANYSGTPLSDPLNLLVASGLLAFVGLAACLSPLRRATRLDPVVALRYE